MPMKVVKREMRAREEGGQNGGLAQASTVPGSHESRKPFGAWGRQPQGRDSFWRHWAMSSHHLFSLHTLSSPVSQAACIQREPCQS